MIVSQRSACAWASVNSSLRTLLPLSTEPVRSSRLTQIVGPPSLADNRSRGWSGVGRCARFRRGGSITSHRLQCALRENGADGVLLKSQLHVFRHLDQDVVVLNLDHFAQQAGTGGDLIPFRERSQHVGMFFLALALRANHHKVHEQEQATDEQHIHQQARSGRCLSGSGLGEGFGNKETHKHTCKTAIEGGATVTILSADVLTAAFRGSFWCRRRRDLLLADYLFISINLKSLQCAGNVLAYELTSCRLIFSLQCSDNSGHAPPNKNNQVRHHDSTDCTTCRHPHFCCPRFGPHGARTARSGERLPPPRTRPLPRAWPPQNP